jgi:FMN-dependent NADH-azoreductase
VLGFVGITYLTVVRAEGTNMGPEAINEPMVAAQKQIKRSFVPAKAA